MTDDRTRAERKALYEKVIRVADRQTDGPQLPGTPGRVLHNLCIPHRRDDSPDGKHVALAIQAAVDNGDLIQWRDGEDTTRYTPATEKKTRKLEAELRERYHEAGENGDRELVARHYQKLQEVVA